MSGENFGGAGWSAELPLANVGGLPVLNVGGTGWSVELLGINEEGLPGVSSGEGGGGGDQCYMV